MFEEPFRTMFDIRHLPESDYLLLNASLPYPILMTASDDQRDILEKEMELKEQLYVMANVKIKGVDRNIKVQGATMKHRFDLSFKKNNEVYLIKYEHIDQSQSVNQVNQATERVFPTIDITSSSYKLVFAYNGRIGVIPFKILKYYYDEVVPFEKFKDFLSREE
jgi:hypothetical protein